MPAKQQQKQSKNAHRKGSAKTPAKQQTKSKEHARPKVEKDAITQQIGDRKQTILSVKDQQQILDVFIRAFPTFLGHGQDTEPLLALLQEVKSHLFRRDFAAAFGRAEYLDAYAARWSPSRALGYAQIFGEVLSISGLEKMEVIKIMCLGGGAGAELAALGAVASYCSSTKGLNDLVQKGDEDIAVSQDPVLEVDLMDIAAWSSVIQALHDAITKPPTLSAYASAAVKAANKAMVSPEKIKPRFRQLDILQLSPIDVQELLLGHDVVTIMFTLNELYSTSLTATQALLENLTRTMKVGAVLLVVDSPGSYSQVKVGENERNYPMKFLLEYALLDETREGRRESRGAGKDDEDDGGDGQEGLGQPQLASTDTEVKVLKESKGLSKWEKLLEDESRWFRLPSNLRYPLELENMRCQIHAFRRI